jgi:hypothetical protein
MRFIVFGQGREKDNKKLSHDDMEASCELNELNQIMCVRKCSLMCVLDLFRVCYLHEGTVDFFLFFKRDPKPQEMKIFMREFVACKI